MRNTLAMENTGSAYVVSLIKSSFNLGLLSLIGIDFISETKQPKEEKQTPTPPKKSHGFQEY